MTMNLNSIYHYIDYKNNSDIFIKPIRCYENGDIFGEELVLSREDNHSFQTVKSYESDVNLNRYKSIKNFTESDETFLRELSIAAYSYLVLHVTESIDNLNNNMDPLDNFLGNWYITYNYFESYYIIRPEYIKKGLLYGSVITISKRKTNGCDLSITTSDKNLITRDYLISSTGFYLYDSNNIKVWIDNCNLNNVIDSLIKLI